MGFLSSSSLRASASCGPDPSGSVLRTLVYVSSYSEIDNLVCSASFSEWHAYFKAFILQISIRNMALITKLPPDFQQFISK